MCHIAGYHLLETSPISAPLRICRRVVKCQMTREANPGMIVAKYVNIFFINITVWR